jgi:hypothetical protein
MIPAGEPTTPAAMAPWPRGGANCLRLRTGAHLAVLAASSEGWLVESGVRLLPGTSLDVVVGRGVSAQPLRATVAHAKVSAIDRDGLIRYEAGLVIERVPSHRHPSLTSSAGEQTTRTSGDEPCRTAALDGPEVRKLAGTQIGRRMP